MPLNYYAIKNNLHFVKKQAADRNIAQNNRSSDFVEAGRIDRIGSWAELEQVQIQVRVRALSRGIDCIRMMRSYLLKVSVKYKFLDCFICTSRQASSRFVE